MFAIHDHVNHGMRDHLKTAGMGLGLVRLLQDAGRAEEAKRTLRLLARGAQGVAEKTDSGLRQGANGRAWATRVSPMVCPMLAALAVLLFAAGATMAGDKKFELAHVEVNGAFVKFDAEKNEITIKVNGKNEMTFRLSQDARVAVAGVITDDFVTLTLRMDGDKNMVIEVRQGKQKGSFSPSPSQI
jgi:hypothetical protein